MSLWSASVALFVSGGCCAETRTPVSTVIRARAELRMTWPTGLWHDSHRFSPTREVTRW